MNASNRRTGIRWATALALPVCVALMAVSAVRAEGEARVAVKVVDETGAPVADLSIEFVAQGDKDYPARTVVTNKKGVASIGKLTPSKYRTLIASDGYRMTRIEFSARRSDGARMASFAEDDVMKNGNPTLEFAAYSRGRLTITVVEGPAPGQAGEGTGSMLSGLSGATGQLAMLNALFDLQKWDDLLTQSEAVLADDPDLGGAHYLRGVAFWKTRQYDDARLHMTRAATLIPDQPSIHGVTAAMLLEHARTLADAGDADQSRARAVDAVGYLETQIGQTPDSRSDLVNLVIAFETAGRTEDAIGALRRLIAADPADPKPHLRLADLQIESGQPAEALETLKAMPGGGEEGLDFLYNAAVEMWNHENMPGTIAAMNAAIEIDPENPSYHQLKGRALLSTGQAAGGVAALKEFVRLSPADADVETERRLIEAFDKAP